MSTATLTGLFFISMLLYQPPSLLLGRIALIFVGIALLGASLPYRKSIALAIDFLIDPEQKDPAG